MKRSLYGLGLLIAAAFSAQAQVAVQANANHEQAPLVAIVGDGDLVTSCPCASFTPPCGRSTAATCRTCSSTRPLAQHNGFIRYDYAL